MVCPPGQAAFRADFARETKMARRGMGLIDTARADGKA
jgi:hypothetical protein